MQGEGESNAKSATFRVDFEGTFNVCDHAGEHTEFRIRITTTRAGPANQTEKPGDAGEIQSWIVNKRYRVLREFKRSLDESPYTMLHFPRRHFLTSQHPDFILQRRKELQAYFNEILKIDPACKTPALRTFLEIDQHC
eukprot:GEMP01016217.1.p1 GENE.GEMP01016217.1~~GEMP01016217.1.p1  ORF type:complete len:138 (+),score=27.62 GEMP01016217.1:76-489(+)